MAQPIVDVDSSVLVLIDVQSSLVPLIYEGDRVVGRAEFLLRAASILGVPIVATEQNPTRMGATDERLLGALPTGAEPIGKMSFSCWGSAEFRSALADSGKRQPILIGIETHICVCLTALELLAEGFSPIVCADAVGARSIERHKLGMERIRDAGGAVAHTESIVYQWLGSADHPKFRDVLAEVKRFP